MKKFSEHCCHELMLAYITLDFSHVTNMNLIKVQETWYWLECNMIYTICQPLPWIVFRLAYSLSLGNNCIGKSCVCYVSLAADSAFIGMEFFLFTTLYSTVRSVRIVIGRLWLKLLYNEKCISVWELMC